MLPGGIPVTDPRAGIWYEHFKHEVLLPGGYFRKIQKMIPELPEYKECLVVIWIDDIPVKMLFVEEGDLSSSEVLEKSGGNGPYEIMELAEKENIKVFHVE